MVKGQAKVKHSAPGQYLGYGLQPVRFCYHLLTAPKDSYVLLEHDDDVSIHYADGSRLLEQTKSALNQNPISDWARDFWKCLFNWLETTKPAEGGDPKISYRLYVTPIRQSSYAATLSNIQLDTEIVPFVSKVKADAKLLNNSKTKAYGFAKRYLDGTLKEQVHLTKNFKLVCEHDPIESIRALFKPSVEEILLEDICVFAIGQAKHMAEVLMRQEKISQINAGSFQRMIIKYVSRINLPALLSFSPQPDSSTVHSKFNGRPTFVRQLQLIHVEKDQQLAAVSDFLRASSDKTKWAAQGVLLPDALNDWDVQLCSRHKARLDRLSIVHSSLPPEKQGALLYAECRLEQMHLEAKSVPDHFVHGCFNDLADRRRLGWHPDYETLLDEEGA